MSIIPRNGDNASPDPAQGLRDQAATVALLRATLAGAKDELDQRRHQFAEQNARLIAEVSNLIGAVSQAEDSFRLMALAAFSATGNKRPCRGVEVKMYSEPRYDPAEALEWAKEHGMALALDLKKFGPIAKAGAVPCVRFEQVYKATIATDLAKALEAPDAQQ